MAVNCEKATQWKDDVAKSVDMYNQWFMKFAPQAFRLKREQSTKDVEEALRVTGNLTNIRPEILRKHPEILPTLRMSTCPPLAVDRLIGLGSLSPSMINRMEEEKKLPVRMPIAQVDLELAKIGKLIEKMADREIFVWLGRRETANEIEIYRAATIVADRLSGAEANPIIRNAQEKRQLDAIKAWLEARQYKQIPVGTSMRFDSMPPGTFSFHMNVPAKREGGTQSVNISIDAVIMPKTAMIGDFPIFLEAKSAGDSTNTNKRRKEEAKKMAQLRGAFGNKLQYYLFLCGYFNAGYLGYSAHDGFDWVWEHRINDLAMFGI